MKFLLLGVSLAMSLSACGGTASPFEGFYVGQDTETHSQGQGPSVTRTGTIVQVTTGQNQGEIVLVSDVLVFDVFAHVSGSTFAPSLATQTFAPDQSPTVTNEVVDGSGSFSGSSLTFTVTFGSFNQMDGGTPFGASTLGISFTGTKN